MAQSPDAKSNPDWFIARSMESYDPVRYLKPSRLAAIGYQFNALHQHFPGASVLEVGVGVGLTTQFLRRLGHDVRTLDVDPQLKADITGSVTQIPCNDGEFDTFVCCQVLEHLKWELVDKALAELARIVKLGGVISVPTNKPTLLLLKYDSRSWGSRRITFGSRRNRRIRQADGMHHWELESNRTTEDFRKKIRAAGLKIDREFQPMECMYHQFFIVRKA